MKEITEDQDPLGPRFINDGFELVKIGIKDRAGNRNAVLLKGFSLAPMGVGKYQRFFLVPVEGFSPVEGKGLAPYFC